MRNVKIFLHFQMNLNPSVPWLMGLIIVCSINLKLPDTLILCMLPHEVVDVVKCIINLLMYHLREE